MDYLAHAAGEPRLEWPGSTISGYFPQSATPPAEAEAQYYRQLAKPVTNVT